MSKNCSAFKVFVSPLAKENLDQLFKIRNAEVPAQFYDDHNFCCDKTLVTHCFPSCLPQLISTRIHYYIFPQMRMSGVRWGRVRECHNWSISFPRHLQGGRENHKTGNMQYSDLIHGLNIYWFSSYGSGMIYPFNVAIRRLFIIFNIC